MAVKALLEFDDPAPAGVTDDSGQSVITMILLKTPSLVRQ